jgi:hypothetical protein
MPVNVYIFIHVRYTESAGRSFEAAAMAVDAFATNVSGFYQAGAL